jgi:FdhD protein
MMLSVCVNGEELVAILCTPENLNSLVAGYLRSEGLINSLDEIMMMRTCVDESLADVRLASQPDVLPTRRIITSGCGGGISFETGMNIEPLKSDRRISPQQIMSSIALLQKEPEDPEGKRGRRRGLHVSALSDGDRIILRSEDIGRHNTIDKLWGECMLRHIPTEDLLLLTTGRISSEMLSKAAKMGIPVIASINSATNRAVNLGTHLGITVVGYTRSSRMTVYCGQERLLTGG